ncbi:MAG TPA: RNA-directed DNA polymerase, partial [Spirochaetia bacterium]|nr:RNA-directed DNA polymerase [Spirochaetia bacterium]
EFAKDPKIRCLSIPQESMSSRKDQASQILHWWQGIEQASIELALDFNYVFHADITDCYASVYTHSIAWAMHEKVVAKSKRRDHSLIGNLIDSRIQDMQHGQTNGIPQGSVLIDLIAEMVLGFGDLELIRRLAKENITDFQILRYRDDYRIFVNDSHAGESILKILTEILIGLGLKLNTSKTTNAQAIIASAVKSDKQVWLRAKQRDANLQKHLLLIHLHGTDFVNAGSLVAALDEFYKRLSSANTVRNPIQLISIAIDIGYNSPRCFPACAAIVS